MLWARELDANPEGIPAVHEVGDRPYVGFCASHGPNVRPGNIAVFPWKQEAQGYYVIGLLSKDTSQGDRGDQGADSQGDQGKHSQGDRGGQGANSVKGRTVQGNPGTGLFGFTLIFLRDLPDLPANLLPDLPTSL